MANVVCKPGGSLGVVRKVRTTYNRNDVASGITLMYSVTYSLPDGHIRVQPDNDFSNAGYAKL
jgi:hypothetical protein